ncbi:hypothetical protein ABT354_01945 [Streptomyces sp. NPDC000594]|uniref:hypothetical protein n=1 Tax=Streptomyces sp. NPDC000594 TaxID=3154261 RepID=UPI00331A733A
MNTAPEPPGPGEEERSAPPTGTPPEGAGDAPEGTRRPDTGEEDMERLFAELLETSARENQGARPYINYTYAPNGTVNSGAVHGDQRVENQHGPTGGGARRIRAREGPIPAAEILDAGFGFAEPDWFPRALEQLDTRILFLTGERGTGRRTAAINLLSRHSGGGLSLRAVDDTENLADWRPTGTGVDGYLLDGLLPAYLGPGMIGNLRRLLAEAGARMVVVLADEPGQTLTLERDLHLTPVHCAPPPPRAVFDTRLAAEVPDPAERARVLARFAPGLLDALLTAELVPAQVVEVVSAVVAATDAADAAGLRDRLSFLAEREAPELLGKLADDPEALAFALATCVFEGHDHRIVREQADRLLTLADGRLHSLLPAGPDRAMGVDRTHGPGEPPHTNPDFALHRSLDELLRLVGARIAPKEVRTGLRYTYTVEPVHFTRHGRGTAVLRYAWRQYGRISALLTDWLGGVAARDENELMVPAGRVIGLAASWGGGRRALQHIHELARSDAARCRFIAAYALGMAAEDPVLVTEIKYRLREWSRQRGWQVRTTVAYACATDFGAARPDLALRLLRRMLRTLDDEHERTVGRAIREALLALFTSGSQSLVFEELAGWTEGGGPDAELALGLLPELLLRDPLWFQERLRDGDAYAATTVALIRRALADERLYPSVGRALLSWCRAARWEPAERAALDILLTTLAQGMGVGELRLFVDIDRHGDPELPGREAAHTALARWRSGPPRAAGTGAAPAGADTHPHGRT